MKSLLVCGDRNWVDFDIIRSYLELANIAGFDTIIEGEAKGADSMARDIGILLGFKVIPVPAEWDKYHKAAGPIRNAKMLEYQPSLCLAFHPNIGQSKGTLDMITKARKAGIPVVLVDTEENVSITLPTKAAWMVTEGVKGFLLDLTHEALNQPIGEVPYTRDDAEDFLKERSKFNAVH